jgi:hypothetical protein
MGFNMDKRMYHKPRFYNKAQSNYKLTGSSMEHLHVLPTGTNINFNDVKKNEFMANWMSDPADTTTLYIFEKHVNTKKTVYSAIASSGELDLNLGERYLLKHDQTLAKICEATLHMVVTPEEYKDPDHYDICVGFKSMSLMVFK